MPKLGQYSFRRILLSKILLLSIPVLLLGEYVTYRKAREGFLQTAQQNLTESAERKGENIRDRIEDLRSTVTTASAAFSVQLAQPQVASSLVQQMQSWLGQDVQCIQLVDLQTQRLVGSTCGNQAIHPNWQDRPLSPTPTGQDLRSQVQLTPTNSARLATQTPRQRQLNLVLSAPVGNNQARYLLSVQASLHRQSSSQPGSLTGYTIVADQTGRILAHPNAALIGQNIRQTLMPLIWQGVFDPNAQPHQNQSLTWFQAEGKDWLVSSSPITIPIGANQTQQWTVLAVAPADNALYGLEGIQQVLMILTIGLVAALLFATYYMARELARPIEQLSRYALQIHSRSDPERSPQNFRIQELNHLAAALDSMVTRLEERAEELEAAWQEAQIASELKSDFLATTSHELRTPLNAIIGCVRLVRDNCCDTREEELEFLQQADDAAIHLLKIINDLLDIAKIEAGKVELNLQPVHIQDLCHQCLRMIQPGAEKKRLTLALDVDEQMGEIPLDERRVRQMVINLLSNAVKFTPEGGHVELSGQIRYGQQLVQDNRPDHSPINPTTAYLCLEVKDSGIGIPKERWNLLFRPFSQVDSSLTRKHEGTGLGLALTKRLVELHGGTLSFQSTPGAGSIFRIWLPYDR
ncbi:sensor histidine kinase [Pantanalinema sp. GBBB05]|uniref:sensor histidine kinase n=1 Tax=Pantanalinema sp. GBBB05 TaxID=2604139 RepID=UPI001D784D52|nr:sensor histidine kinase [Pantanalinema sp. GBBB05]